MNRWIAFDGESVAAAFAAAQVTPELHDTGDALGAALSSERVTVVIMPARTPGHALVAQVRRFPASRQDALRPLAYAAGGFLGLTDEPVYEPEPAQPKKWWQKILD